MKERFSALIIITLVHAAFLAGGAHAQEPMNASSTWFGQVLRQWFPRTLPIQNREIPVSMIRCADEDLTHFDPVAGKIKTGQEGQFRIEGVLRLDPLPEGITPLPEDEGGSYKTLLQGYLFSPKGELIWVQHGLPDEGAWTSVEGATLHFRLAAPFEGSLTGCTAAIVATGGPLLVHGSPQDPLILGMRRFTFPGEADSTGYHQDRSRGQEQTRSAPPSLPVGDAAAQAEQPLRYEQKSDNGRAYTQVIGIPLETRKKIYFDLVGYQEETDDDAGSYKVFSQKTNYPEQAIRAINSEGTARDWPIP